MTPQENAAFLRTLQGRVAEAAAPVADDMADVMNRAVRFELTRVSHPAGMFWKAPRGRPPATASGHLVMSQVIRPAFGLVRASSLVGNTAVYAAIQEEGGRTWPSHHKYMKWSNTGGVFYRKLVTVPEHAYYAPAIRKIIANGSLQAHAMTVFETYMSPLIRLFRPGYCQAAFLLPETVSRRMGVVLLCLSFLGLVRSLTRMSPPIFARSKRQHSGRNGSRRRILRRLIPWRG